MDNLRDQVLAFLKRPRCLSKDEPSPTREELFQQYLEGKHRTDPEFLDHLAKALEHARVNAIVSDGADGPERDAANVYKRIAAILDEIRAEVLVEVD